MRIITNNVPRPLLSGCDLTESERADFDYIDYIDECYERFFRYKGNCYDFHDMIPTRGHCNGLASWDCYIGESYWSGIVARFVDDCGTSDAVIVGSYYE